MADGHHIENRFGHNSAADCLISVKSAWGSSFLSEFRQRDSSPRSAERRPISVFIYVVAESRSEIPLAVRLSEIDGTAYENVSLYVQIPMSHKYV